MSEWTIACQASLFMGFPREDYWSGVPFPSPGDRPDPEIEPVSPALAGRFFTTEPPGKVFSLCKFPGKQLQTRKGTLQNRLAIFLKRTFKYILIRVVCEKGFEGEYRGREQQDGLL